MVKIFFFSRSCCKYNLAGTFVLSYYQQKTFFILLCSVPDNIRFRLQIQVQISNRPCDWNVECKRRKLVNTIPNRIRNLCLQCHRTLAIYNFTYEFERFVRLNILSSMLFTCTFPSFLHGKILLLFYAGKCDNAKMQKLIKWL